MQSEIQVLIIYMNANQSFTVFTPSTSNELVAEFTLFLNKYREAVKTGRDEVFIFERKNLFIRLLNVQAVSFEGLTQTEFERRFGSSKPSDPQVSAQSASVRESKTDGVRKRTSKKAIQ